MMRYIIIMFLLFWGHTLQSQNFVCNADSSKEMNVGTQNYLIGARVDAEKLSFKSHFLNNSQYSSVYLSNGKVMEDKLIGYNIKQEELYWIHFKNKQQNAVKIAKHKVDGFYFPGTDYNSERKFLKKEIPLNYTSDTKVVFLEQLVAGDIPLYLRHQTEFSDHKNKYEYFKMYYTRLNGKWHNINSSKRGLLKTFEGNVRHTALKNLIKEHNLNVKKQSDLIKTFTLLNQN